MLSDEAGRAVTELARAMLSLRPLARALGSGARLTTGLGPGAEAASAAAVLDAVAAELDVPGLDFTAAGDTADEGVFERVMAEHLDLPARLAALGPITAKDRPAAVAEARKAAARVAAESFGRHRRPTDAVSFDGARLPVYEAGEPGRPAVVLASACGMPAELCEPWIELLSRDHHVVTWESRGLFGGAEDFDSLGQDTAAQAADVFAVMDHCGIESAHVMGFCGGSVIALAAAGARPERVSSLSLWHGAYELGEDCPKADHHRNMQALMAMAAGDRDTAASVQSVFVQTMISSLPPGMAHLVLYPYATPELFYRYCRVNGPITDIDVRGMLAGVTQPALVVTSEDDSTADPAGSRWVAERLPEAELRVEPTGDHISLFTMGGAVGALAVDFLARVTSRTAG
ncbi:alpha/beta fold hydrolase [Streptomyces sp. KLOTTS4A1]|uniref:alpha/beta fold hydrolase n=1 Tax=Streptomyces sp. KLOTTS4A1 TaxID=3390996 RepID=UPI0039F4C127